MIHHLPMNSLTLAPDASIDLHMHTTYSDGKWPAQKLIDHLAGEHFDLVAVTDHDRVDKIAEIQELGAQQGLAVLSGVEMSTEWDGRMGDLLCYGFDVQQNEIAPLAEQIVQGRSEHTQELYENLLKKGYEFPRQAEIFAHNSGKMTYPYEVGTLLREHGYVEDWPGAMRILYGVGYHPIRVDMGKTVDAVHRSGGVCVIAHPGRQAPGFTFYTPELLDRLRSEVPIDGIEVCHPTHTPELTEAFQQYVEKYNLLASAGSDSHCIPGGRLPMKHRAELSRHLLERVGVRVA